MNDILPILLDGLTATATLQLMIDGGSPVVAVSVLTLCHTT